MSEQQSLDLKCINTIRTLSMDAVQAANSGHPGTPMAMAPVAYMPLAALPALRPRRPDLAQPRPLRAVGRPRLDAALLAAAPDRREGGQQGVRDAGQAVGDARRHQDASASSTASAPATPSTAGPAASRRPPGRSARAWPPASAWPSPASGWRTTSTSPASTLFDLQRLRPLRRRLHDGGHLRRGRLAGRPPEASNLCWIYDNNHITIEGNTALAFSEDVATRFIGYGWNVTRVGDANDLEMLGAAPSAPSRTRTDRPTLIIVDSHIGYGAPNKQDTSDAHGEPLGEEEIRLPSELTAGPRTPSSSSARRRLRALPGRHRQARQASCATPGSSKFEDYKAKYPELADQLNRMQHRQLPEGWDKDLPTFPADAKGMAGRDVVRQGAQRPGQERALADRRLGRPGAVHQDAADLRGRRRLRARPTTAAATSTSASASTPWAPSSTAWPWSRCGPTAPAS